MPESLLPDALPIAHTLWQLTFTALDVPLLLLPIVMLFLPQIRRIKPRLLTAISVLLLGYIFLATYPSHLRGNVPLEPMSESIGEWVNVHGTFEWLLLKGEPPVFLGEVAQVVLTLLSFGGLIGLIASIFYGLKNKSANESLATVSWKELGILLGPFTLVYLLLLVPRAATTGLHDRYLLPPLAVALLCLLRYYQERIRWSLPIATVLLVSGMGSYSVVMVHNMFALYRARVEIAAEVHSAGVPYTAVDNGWEYNYLVELRHAPSLNNDKITVPVGAYVATPPMPAGTCSMNSYEYTPHLHPLYGVSFNPHACYGPAPFAPVVYSRWFARRPGTLYVVYYRPRPTP